MRSLMFLSELRKSSVVHRVNLNRIDLETSIGRHKYENLGKCGPGFCSGDCIGYLGTGRLQ